MHFSVKSFPPQTCTNVQLRAGSVCKNIVQRKWKNLSRAAATLLYETHVGISTRQIHHVGGQSTL